MILKEDWGSIRKILFKEKVKKVEDNTLWFRICHPVDFSMWAYSKTCLTVTDEQQSLFINLSGNHLGLGLVWIMFGLVKCIVKHTVGLSSSK